MAKIIIDQEWCKGCELCVDSCPHNLIRTTNQLNRGGYNPVEFYDRLGKCTGCGLCALMCPDCAIEVYREEERGG